MVSLSKISVAEKPD